MSSIKRTPSPTLGSWIRSYPALARALYDAAEPLTVRTEVDLETSGYTRLRTLFERLQNIGGLECVAEGSDRRGQPDINRYERTPAFESAVERYTDPLDEREGWCVDPDCGRRSIEWPGDGSGPRCVCGAAHRDEVGDDE